MIAYIGLGSNLGNRAENLQRAVQLLCDTPGVIVRRVASLYRTAPLGVSGQPEFLNSVVEVVTVLSPHELLERLLTIETALGRVRRERWGPRVIDLDLLLYDEVTVATPTLELPHPRLVERAFVVVPLAELEPELLLPGGFKAAALATELQQEQYVERMAAEWVKLA